MLACLAPGTARAADCVLTGSGPVGALDTSTYYRLPGARLDASMIFVDFPDHPASAAEAAPQSALAPKLTDWATRWFAEVSYGRTALDVKPGMAWLRMSKPAASYSFKTYASQRAYMEEAVR